MVKVGWAGALAAASAWVVVLMTMKPERLRDALGKLSGGAGDLFGDLEERAGSAADTVRPEAEPEPEGRPMSQANHEKFDARRRERKKRRDQRRQQAKT